MSILDHKVFSLYIKNRLVLQSGASIQDANGNIIVSDATPNALVYKGVLDCSASPNYPAGNAGDTYIISVAGKIGGASGTVVEAGDMAICKTDSTAAGTQAAVGAQWNIIQTNITAAALATTIIGTLITGFVSGAGTVAATDTILQAVNKLDGNDAAKVAGAGTVVANILPKFSSTTGKAIGQSRISDSGTIIDFVDWSINASGALNPATDSTKDIGNLAVNPRDIHVSRSLIKKAVASTEGYGQLAVKSIAASKTLTNAQTNTLAIQIPSGAKLIGVQLRNDTIIAGVDDATGLVPITTYSAIYATGATQTINATVAVAKNTKVNKSFDANAATDILSAATDITLDAGAGNKFTAGGIIAAVAYYYELTSMTDAA